MNLKVNQSFILMKVDLHMNPLGHTVIQRKEKDVRIFSTGEQKGELMRLVPYYAVF